MTPEQIKEALELKFTQVQGDLAEAQKNNASKDDILKLTESIKTQGQALDDFMETQKQKVVKNYLGQFGDFINANKDKLKEIQANKAGEIEFIPKAVGDISTGSGTDISTPPLDVSTSLGSFNLRNDNSLLSLATISRTGSPSFSYTEMTPKEGGYAFVAEGGTKPQIDFKWENRYETPKKVAAYEILTEESITDYARMMSVAREYLVKQHDLFKVDGAYFGDGLGNNPTGATVYGRTFVSTGMVDFLPAGTSNFMDVVNAIITDIYRTASFTDEAHYQPNIVMVNPIDFYKQLVAAKDANGLPLYPQAGLFNEVRIGGVVIKPWIKIPVGKIFVADMSKYNIVNYVPFSIRVGWINDQFITNKFTMLGESRFFQYVKNLDQGAFVYDDIATVQAAITAI
jgi:HK97 family phage major capsid protein